MVGEDLADPLYMRENEKGMRKIATIVPLIWGSWRNLLLEPRISVDEGIESRISEMDKWNWIMESLKDQTIFELYKTRLDRIGEWWYQLFRKSECSVEREGRWKQERLLFVSWPASGLGSQGVGVGEWERYRDQSIVGSGGEKNQWGLLLRVPRAALFLFVAGLALLLFRTLEVSFSVF